MKLLLRLLPTSGFILIFTFGMAGYALPQPSDALLRNGEFHTYLTSYHNAGIKEISVIPASDRINLAVAHYQRARVLEKVYELTLHSTGLLIEFMAEELEISSVQGEKLRLEARRLAFHEKDVSSLAGIANLSSVERGLVQWHNRGFMDNRCNPSSGEADCRLFDFLAGNNPERYADVMRMLTEYDQMGREALLNLLAAEPGFTGRVGILVNWLNRLQLSYIADYTLSAWLFQSEGHQNADASFFLGGHYSHYQPPAAPPSNILSLYAFTGGFAMENGHCSPTHLPANTRQRLGSDNQLRRLAPAILSRCASRSSLIVFFGSTLNELQSNNPVPAQFLAESMIALGLYEDALALLGSHIRRTQITDLAAATPVSLASLALTRLQMGATEDWTEARRHYNVIEREFSTISAAALVLQLATEPEILKQSLIYID